ncbi:DUF2330 domain-containing protein [Halovulum sp. GXIMD14793]
MRLLTLALCLLPGLAQAFCGFYVARADGNLYNEASKVVFVRDGQNSTITMSSDYRGPASEFALVVPTPKVLKRDQIATVKPETVNHLDEYSAPRLVEYHDGDPCMPVPVYEMALSPNEDGAFQKRSRGAAALGVKVEAQYAVGSYDIVILSAKESDGLTIYLKQEGYNIPDGAELILADYIAAGMKFFVARVNLERHAKADKKELQPLRISFRSKNFMLPLQLGKVNADKTQDLLIMTLTRQGRVEASNYANARIPSDVNIPTFVRDYFGDFYKATFARAARPNTVMTEYAWDMAWCDPCAADPLTREELQELGVNWLKPGDNVGQDVFVTRMHVQYERDTFQKDLLFRITDDRENFQGRYIMNVPFDGKITCDEGVQYVRDTRSRMQKEAATLSELTGWRRSKIDAQIRATVPKVFKY